LTFLFGTVTVVDLSTPAKVGSDYIRKPLSLLIVAGILVFGIGDMRLNIGDLALVGIGLAGDG